MDIKSLSKILCCQLDKICPQKNSVNEVIQYGLELLSDTFIKLVVIMLLGILLKSGLETTIILIVFCSLRLQAGGKHAKSRLGCTICMVLIWIVSLAGYLYFKIWNIALVYIYIFSILVIIYRAPQTCNIKYFTKTAVYKKKLYAVLLFTFFIFSGLLNVQLRELLIYPAVLEVLSLLPENNIQGRRKLE